MSKKTYLVSAELFLRQMIYFAVAVIAYYFLVDVILNLEKLFDVLFLSPLFYFIALIISFILAVKTVKKKNAEIFSNHRRLVLLFYVVNIFVASLPVVAFLIFFKSWPVDLLLLELFCLYAYYYFSRLVYRESFTGKPWVTAMVLVVLSIVGYSVAFIPPLLNYQKAYKEIKIEDNFIYFYKLDLSALVGEKQFEKKNSAKEMIRLIKLINADEELKDKGEQLSYILPTEEELALLVDIADNEYLSFSDEFLSKKTREAGGTMIISLNNLRLFSRGLAKVALSESAVGSKEEARKKLDDLMLVGNQMLDADNDSLIVRLVGESMIREAFVVLSQINYDGYEADIVATKIEELENMRNGNRALMSGLTEMNNKFFGSSVGAASFFKHLEAVKEDVGDDFDDSLITYFLSGRFIVSNLTYPDSEGGVLQESVISSIEFLQIIPYMVSETGKGYIVYREAKKLSQEFGHETLKYYFTHSYSGFIKANHQAMEESSSAMMKSFFK
jgi:hypothetical protein